MLPNKTLVTSYAKISPCEKYRYSLCRNWGETSSERTQRYIVFIGLNPSTADDNFDDPTIRRMMSFANDWGYKEIEVVNLFAYRATDPKQLKKVDDPIGPENDGYINRRIRSRYCAEVIFCWGSHDTGDREIEVLRNIHKISEPLPAIKSFGMTKRGDHPKHPLYMPQDTEMITLGEPFFKRRLGL